jgi:sporulation protein YlmC with PRC-barrel domain
MSMTARRTIRLAHKEKFAMATLEDTTSTSGRLIAASQVSGTVVYNPQGERLGTIEDVMIDKISGRVVYAVLSFGGFLGIGDRHYPLPWPQLRYDTVLGGYVVNLDKRALESAPSYRTGETPNWEDETWGRSVYGYYKTDPYWSQMP